MIDTGSAPPLVAFARRYSFFLPADQQPQRLDWGRLLVRFVAEQVLELRLVARLARVGEQEEVARA